MSSMGASITLGRLRSLGIGGRMALAGGLIALVAAVAFTLVLSTLGDLRTSARRSLDSQQLLVAARRLETVTLQLQSGHLGYVVTGEGPSAGDEYLRGYELAARELEPATVQLDSLALELGRRDQLSRIRVIGTAIRIYYDTWSRPLASLAARDRAAARRQVLTGRGALQIARIRRLFDELARDEEAIAATREAEAQEAGRRATIVAVASLGVLLALLGAIVAYFIRVVVVPVRRVDLANQRRAAGELDLRVEPVGVGEARRLVGNFNEMADASDRTYSDLARGRAELEAVLHSTADAMTMIDRDGALVFSNDQMERVWRELGAGVDGGIWDRLAALAQRSGGLEPHAEAFARLAEDDEFVYQSPFDVPALDRSFVGYTGPVRDSSGFVSGRLFTLRETTAERVGERAKEEFLATVSHELRTPLTSIIGYLELVREGEAGELSPDQERFLTVVDRSARHLHGLVDDLLFFGRASEGRLDLELAPLDFAILVEEATELCSPAADEKRIELESEIQPGLELAGDRRRLTQLVTNLIGNALKFTPTGGHVDVRLAAKDGSAVLEIADTGIGIAPEELERLFERFFRASTARAAQVQGTGLGLAISKAIVDGHGGTIDVRSTPGVGTTFRVELPLEAGQ